MINYLKKLLRKTLIIVIIHTLALIIVNVLLTIKFISFLTIIVFFVDTVIVLNLIDVIKVYKHQKFLLTLEVRSDFCITLYNLDLHY